MDLLSHYIKLWMVKYQTNNGNIIDIKEVSSVLIILEKNIVSLLYKTFYNYTNLKYHLNGVIHH